MLQAEFPRMQKQSPTTINDVYETLILLYLVHLQTQHCRGQVFCKNENGNEKNILFLDYSIHLDT